MAEWDRKGVFGGEEEEGGVRSGPGEARTILLLHIISVRPSKQPLMVRTFLKVYLELGSYFLFLQEQITDIITSYGTYLPQGIHGARLLFFVSARTNKRHHHLVSSGMLPVWPWQYWSNQSAKDLPQVSKVNTCLLSRLCRLWIT